MEYIGSHIYEDGVLKQTLIEGGYLTYSGNTPAYHFYVKDHLGNNRMVMSASGAVEQVVHYYPYGMAFADGTNADAQRFKYNGKELDAEDGLNWMDYGARMYDAATGRWGGVDALAEKYSNLSVYGYCGGNPVRFVDVDGRVIGDISAELGQSFDYDGNRASNRAVTAEVDVDAAKIGVGANCILGVEGEINWDFTEDNTFVEIYKYIANLFNE